MSSENEIPQTANDWYRRVDYKLRNKDLSLGLKSVEWSSASKMGFDQFLLLRAYWKTRGVNQFNLANIVDPERAQEAKDLLSSKHHQHFEAYLNTLRSRIDGPRRSKAAPPPLAAGPFALVLHQQDQVAIRDGPPEDVNPKVWTSPRYHTRSKAAQKQALEESPTPAAKQADSLTASMASMSLGKPVTPPETANRRPDATRTPQAQYMTTDATLAASGSQKYSAISADSAESAESRLSAFSYLSPEQVKAASDEQIVNAALVSFLQATTMYSCPTMVWTLHRNIFRMSNLYEARTDGCLWIQGTEKPLIILETKAHVRNANRNKIMIQETAQMAAWILQESSTDLPGGIQHSSTRHRRLIISQDSREVYVTVGEYDDAYKDYLHETSQDSKNPFDAPGYSFDDSSKEPFLQMTCYGPFDIHQASHMRSLATAVVAFTRALSG